MVPYNFRVGCQPVQQNQGFYFYQFWGELQIFSMRLYLQRFCRLATFLCLCLTSACAPPMGHGIFLEDQPEAVVLAEKQKPSTSIAVSNPSGLNNNLSEDSAVPGSSEMVEPQGATSTAKMLELMEESNREAALAVVIQAEVPSPRLSPTQSGSEVHATHQSQEPSEISSNKLIGFLVPLSGRGSALGEAMLNAAQMALFERFDPETELIIRDTKGTPEGAYAAAMSLISVGADVIVGPLFNTSVRSVAPLISSANIPTIVFSNDITVAGEGIHVFGFTPEQEVGRILSFATREGNLCGLAIVPDSAYGEAVSEAFVRSDGRAAVSESVAVFSSDGSDITAVVKELAAGHAAEGSGIPLECILIAAGGDQLRAIATRLPYYDVDMASVQLLGTALWRSQGLGQEPALRGGWFAGPAPGDFEQFNQDYQTAFGSPPPFRAALAYDAISLVGKLLAGTQSGYDINDLLLDDAGFHGIQGIFRFRKSGRTDRPLAVYEVTRRGSKVIDPALQRFSY